MKLCPSIVIYVTFLVMLDSSALKLLPLPKLSPTNNPWIQPFRLIKEMFIVDWVLNFLHCLLLHCHKCNLNRMMMPVLRFLKGLSG
jgi:hypothetical protein